MGWNKADETERRAQILDAAVAVAVRDGLDRLTIRSVATQAGLSHGLVHFHFGTKEALVDAMLDDLLEWLATPAPGQSSTSGSIWALARAEVDALDADRAALLLQFWALSKSRPGVADRLRSAVETYQHNLAPAAQRASRTSEQDPPPEDGLITAVLGLALRALLETDGPQ